MHSKDEAGRVWSMAIFGVDQGHRKWLHTAMRHRVCAMRIVPVLATVTSLLFSGFAFAQTPTSPTPANSSAAVTATCKDGTPFAGRSRSGACRGHGGVQAWGAAPAAAVTPTAPSSQAPVGQPAPTATPQPNARGTGGAGQVWVNPTSKVYHCPGSRYYGKTKAGSYMSEAAAKAEGDRPSRGKVCG